MEIETKHKVFNPIQFGPGLSTLAAICANMEENGWELVKIVPHHTYESVAVFQRIRKEEETDDNSGTYL